VTSAAFRAPPSAVRGRRCLSPSGQFLAGVVEQHMLEKSARGCLRGWRPFISPLRGGGCSPPTIFDARARRGNRPPALWLCSAPELGGPRRRASHHRGESCSCRRWCSAASPCLLEICVEGEQQEAHVHASPIGRRAGHAAPTAMPVKCCLGDRVSSPAIWPLFLVEVLVTL